MTHKTLTAEPVAVTPDPSLPRHVRLALYLGWTQIEERPVLRRMKDPQPSYWFGLPPEGSVLIRVTQLVPHYDTFDGEAGPLLVEMDRRGWEVAYVYRRMSDGMWSLTISKAVRGWRLYGHGEGATLAEAVTNAALEAFEHQAQREQVAA